MTIEREFLLVLCGLECGEKERGKRERERKVSDDGMEIF